MEEAPRLTPGAVAAIWELPDGPAAYKPVLQVASLRLVTAKKSAVSEVAAASGQQHKAEEFRMLLSDGVYSQQSVLATALNHLVRDGALRPGAVVQLQDVTCNNFQGRRILTVIELDVLQGECAKIRTPKIYDKTLSGEQEVNLPPNTVQTNNGKYSGDPDMMGSAVATRVEQCAINMSYDGTYNGVHGTVDSSICQRVQPGPNNVLSGGSYGTMSAQNTTKANVVQPHSQQPLLNSHQNQRLALPGTARGFGPPGDIYSLPVQPLYQQLPPTYRNSDTSSILLSKFYVVLGEADDFVMNEDESPEELYQRLMALVVSLKDHGSKDVDDNWIKRKFLKAIIPFDKNLSYMIRHRPDFHTLSSNDVLSEFISMGIFIKSAENALARARGVRKQPNLALKGKLVQEDEKEEYCPEEIKYAFNEHMALASRTFWRAFWANERSFKSNNSREISNGFKPKQRVRTCYNCWNVGHFATEVPI